MKDGVQESEESSRALLLIVAVIFWASCLCLWSIIQQNRRNIRVTSGQAKDIATKSDRRQSEARRAVATLEARLLATGAKDSRRKDLLLLQASAHADLQRALSEAVPPSSGNTRSAAATTAGFGLPSTPAADDNEDGIGVDLRRDVQGVREELRRALSDALPEATECAAADGI